MNTQKIQHTHDHELTHSMVHYLLAIHKLKDTHGYARVTDIAKYLQLTKGSVSTALSNLKRKKLVTEDEAKFVSLSERGHSEVHRILSNRTLLFYFFKDVLGLSDEVAHKDSCLMEHLMSEEAREKLFLFLKNIESMGSDSYRISLDINSFKSFGNFLEEQKGDTYL